MHARIHNELESNAGIGSDSDMFRNPPLYTSSLQKRPSSNRLKTWSFSNSFQKICRKVHGSSKGHCINKKVLKLMIFDPKSGFLRKWNNFFYLIILVAVFIDPLFIYLPFMDVEKGCFDIHKTIKIIMTALRTIIDVVYLSDMIIRFRTAFIAPSSKALGRGELILDSSQIAKRYLKKDFLLNFLALLPLPQVVIWVIIPLLKMSTAASTAKQVWRLVVVFQYLIRLHRISRLNGQMVKITGEITETAWGGAAYNLFLYLLASNLAGACWYTLAIERQYTCWQKHCLSESSCKIEYLNCWSPGIKHNLARNDWFSSTQIFDSCSPDISELSDAHDYGIYAEAIINGITSTTDFVMKYCYSFWWGLRNLGSLGQSLLTTTNMGEMFFSIALSVIGLILVSLFIGNMENYLQSLNDKLEEMRSQKSDTEQWMHHRRVPPVLRDRVRRFEQYKWVATRGVDEESIIQSLPMDLRREIKRHLCLDLVRRVPLFKQIDDQLADAMCQRLTPALHIPGTYLFHECDPVSEMLFIIRGNLESYTITGGKKIDLNKLGPGDFCGEELITWALHPNPSDDLPLSTRTVKALSEVEAFALAAEDLKIVTRKFKRDHWKKLQHLFRVYSQQWRTWAALNIQAAWRSYKRLKYEKYINAEETRQLEAMPMGEGNISLGAAVFASRFVRNALNGVQRLQFQQSSAASMPKIPKPEEPDFSVGN